jgi:hypothetical protein
MADKRIEDFGKQRTWYRSDRMMEQNGQWYFLTREGTIEGPYDTRLKAGEALGAFIEAKALGLLSQASELSLSPLDATYKR